MGVKNPKIKWTSHMEAPSGACVLLDSWSMAMSQISVCEGRTLRSSFIALSALSHALRRAHEEADADGRAGGREGGGKVN